MSESLKNKIKIVEAIPLTIHNGDADASLEGDAIDMASSVEEAYDSALVIANIGAVGADVSATTVKVEESDTSNFASASVVKGGEATSVLAGDLTVTFQIQRTKRYIRVVLDVTEAGASDDVEIASTAILNNWAVPYNV